jgi:DNA repair protein RecO (recombination protein O)
MNIQVVFSKKKKGSLPVLTNVDLIDPFEKIRIDVEKVGYASYWAEIINFYLEEHKEQQQLYKLFVFALNALHSGTIAKQIINLLFQVKFMELSGFAPDLKKCGICRTPVDQTMACSKKLLFDIKNGCLVCEKCIKKTGVNNIKISKGTLKQLAWISDNEISKAGRIKFSNSAIVECENMLHAFIPFHIGRNFKSIRFLKRIMR